MEYASKAVGNAGLTTGIIGTALGALGGTNGLNLFGARNTEDAAVTRHEASMLRELIDKDHEISLLKADKYTDQKFDALSDKMNARFTAIEGQLAQQAVWNASQTGLISALQGQVAQLQAMTKMVIPNASVMPGWGGVTISPGTPATTTTTTGG